MSIFQLIDHLRNNRPVILLMQAWSDPIVDYTNNFDDGHFVVAIGYDLNYIYFEDPWILGSIAYIPRN